MFHTAEMGEVDRRRRRLRWTLAIVAIAPLAGSVPQIVIGPTALPGVSEDLQPTLDSSYRYANAYLATVGPVIWSQLGRVDDRSPLLTWALSSMFLGGLARLRSWKLRGRPHLAVVAATTGELLLAPTLLCWHKRLSR